MSGDIPVGEQLRFDYRGKKPPLESRVGRLLDPPQKIVDRLLRPIGVEHLERKAEPAQFRLNLGQLFSGGKRDPTTVDRITLYRAPQKIVGTVIPQIDRDIGNDLADFDEPVVRRVPANGSDQANRPTPGYPKKLSSGPSRNLPSTTNSTVHSACLNASYCVAMSAAS